MGSKHRPVYKEKHSGLLKPKKFGQTPKSSSKVLFKL